MLACGPRESILASSDTKLGWLPWKIYIDPPNCQEGEVVGARAGTLTERMPPSHRGYVAAGAVPYWERACRFSDVLRKLEN